MACTIITTPAVGAEDWTNFLTQVEKQRKGYMAVSLTAYDTTSASTIASGSVFELDGSFYTCTDTAITLAAGAASANVAVYYTAVPIAGGTSCVFYMDDTAPIWVDDKQGWYGSAASLTRYLGGCYIGTAGVYYRKWIYQDADRSVQAFKHYGNGNISDIESSGYYFNDVTAGSNLLLSQDTERETLNAAYVKLKEVICPADGIVTTKFDMTPWSSGDMAYGRIYINGVAVGDVHSSDTVTWVTYTDSSVTVAKNDLVQVYGHCDGTHLCKVRNFRIYCNETVGAVTLKLYEILGII